MSPSPLDPARRLCVWVCPFLAVALLCACTLVGPYDPITDGNVAALRARTETVLFRADQGTLSKEERDQFFEESIGLVRAMRARAELFERNDDELEALALVEESLLNLSTRETLTSGIALGLRGSLQALQQIQLAKKRSSKRAVTPSHR